MDNPKRITVEVTEDEHREAKTKAAKVGVSISYAVRELLHLWASGRISIRTGKQVDDETDTGELPKKAGKK